MYYTVDQYHTGLYDPGVPNLEAVYRGLVLSS